MRQLVQKLRSWVQRGPLQFWFGLGVLVLGSGLVFAKTYTFKRAVSYDPCETNYGETVGGWDGRGQDVWNESNFRYEVKRFRLEATAPAEFFANIQESPPNRISTATCQTDFDNLIDPNNQTYRWYGAKPMSARLGVPDLGEPNQAGRINSDDANTKPNRAVSPPVFAESQQRAAAWVDDGAQANLFNQDQTKQQLLWCQGLVATGCSDVSNLNSQVVRGAGYLFVEDNCPGSETIDCATARSWYQHEGTPPSLDYSQSIGRNERGELLPFRLQLEAVSTYANRLGAWMVMTFKYPKLVDVSNQLSLNKTTYQVGETITANLSLAKIGPEVSSLNGTADLNNHPLQASSNFTISPETINAVNNGQTAAAQATFKITEAAKPGQCYNLSFNFAGESAVEVDNSRQIKIAPINARYCIANPAVASYTYSVTSRGQVLSNLDEFAAQAAESLAAAPGWAAAGAKFSRVAGGGDFTLVLTSPDQMTSFSGACDATYSCQAGRFVIINDERWRTATPSWNNSGGSLRDYRHMVINHETGHWLGFGHLNCPAPGALAPVMQQQSISLQGCVHNPWPTPAEIATLKSRL